MKSLKEYIYEVSLTEGLLDRVKNKEVNHEILIEEFLKENYDIRGSYTIKETKDGFVVDVKGEVKVKNRDITSLTNGLFEFGEVSRDFDCASCKSLKSLNGAPKIVWWSFDCSGCKSLKTLKGAPEKVGWSFDCSKCDLLTSLEGAPKEVEENFDCSNCKSLKTLEGAPKKVGDRFYCDCCGVQFTEEDVRKYTRVIRDIFV